MLQTGDGAPSAGKQVGLLPALPFWPGGPDVVNRLLPRPVPHNSNLSLPVRTL